MISCKKQKAENRRFNLLVQGKLCCVRSICGVVSPARSKQMVAGTESDYTDTTQSNLIIILAPGCVWYSRWRLFFLLRLLRHEATDFRARRRIALFLKTCPLTHNNTCASLTFQTVLFFFDYVYMRSFIKLCSNSTSIQTSLLVPVYMRQRKSNY